MLHHDILAYLVPAERADWHLKNPLLLAAYPAGCARRAAELSAGLVDATKLAADLAAERARLRIKLGFGYEGSMSNEPDWQRIEELLQSGHIDKAERSTVLAFGRKAHASEWPWLIARLEEVITRRADACETEEPQRLAQAA